MEHKSIKWTWIFLFYYVFIAYSGVRGIEDDNLISAGRKKLEELRKTLGIPLKSDKTLLPFTTTKPDIPSAIPSLPSHSIVHIASKDLETIPEDASSIQSYQDFYRIFYGTEKGVEYLRRHYGPNKLHEARARFGGVDKGLNDVRKASEHFLKIRTRAKCKEPAPRLIRVKDYFPDPSREYLPRCTILHRCDDTSGCCDNDAFHCAPVAMQEVSLHFYVLKVDRNGLDYRGPDNSVEKLLFVNHTACHCQPINDLPRLVALNETQSKEASSLTPQDGDMPLPSTTPHLESRKCRECPVPFNSRVYKDGRCGCDCFDRQKPCLRIKRGKQPLTEIEKRCVQANFCHIPDCEYGIFDPKTGYCPKRHDEVTRVQRTNTKPNTLSSQRWAFIERD